MGDVSGEDATSTVIGGDLPAGRWGAVGVVWWEKGREGVLEACSGVCGGCGAKGEFPNKWADFSTRPMTADTSC